MAKTVAEGLSRREFLRGAGALAGGAALTSLALSPSCQGTGSETSSSPPTESTTAPPVSSPTSSSPATSSSTAPSGTTPYVYNPAGGFGVLKPVGCTSYVADDRFYTVDHVWVKPLVGNLVALGISDKLEQMLLRITDLLLPKTGETVAQGDSFGYMEGDKLSCDIFAPVSGRVYQVNNSLWNHAGDNRGFYLITGDPYITGWLIVVELSKPEEMKNLLSAQRYTELQAKV